MWRCRPETKADLHLCGPVLRQLLSSATNMYGQASCSGSKASKAAMKECRATLQRAVSRNAQAQAILIHCACSLGLCGLVKNLREQRSMGGREQHTYTHIYIYKLEGFAADEEGPIHETLSPRPVGCGGAVKGMWTLDSWTVHGLRRVWVPPRQSLKLPKKFRSSSHVDENPPSMFQHFFWHSRL
mmetsp:Transcript_61671/g.130163  ORF Transcript_61671/g.130163 Transcript_61671/m.130163 type:complete len:185 (+) Transcript_61671:237-791(+)